MAKERAHHFLVRQFIDAPDNTLSREDIIKFLQSTRYASTAHSHCIIYINDIRTYLDGIISYEKRLGGRHVTHVKLANAMMFDRETATKRKEFKIDFSALINSSALEGATDVVTIDATEYRDVTENVSEPSPMLLLTYEPVTVTMAHPRVAGNCNSVITPDVIYLDNAKKTAKKRSNKNNQQVAA